MTQPHEMTITEMAESIRLRQLSPVELMESLLSRSRILDPKLKIWVTLDEDIAIRAARASADEIALRGSRGPLHGIPVGVKDIYYTAGFKTTGCSPIYAEFVPSYDATSVSLMRANGAIVMGKTVTTEFACMDPPPTKNPYNPAHTPGGSSSGSAVGVAAGVFPAALGSQTAGSVLRPASYNGVVGVKPTFGRISKYGVMPVAWSLDTMGFFTRSVMDAAIILTTLAGYDPKDATSSTSPARDYTNALTTKPIPPKIGVVKTFMDRASSEVHLHTETAMDTLRRGGAYMDEVYVTTDFDTLTSAHHIVMAVEAATVHREDFGKMPNAYGPKVRSLIETGMLISASEYIQAQQVRNQFRVEIEGLARLYDVLFTPSTTTHAPRDLTTTGDPILQSPWTTAGLPAMTLPSGLSASGLPLGIQLAAESWAEEQLLRTALWCENVLAVNLSPPLD